MRTTKDRLDAIESAMRAGLTVRMTPQEEKDLGNERGSAWRWARRQTEFYGESRGSVRARTYFIGGYRCHPELDPVEVFGEWEYRFLHAPAEASRKEWSKGPGSIQRLLEKRAEGGRTWNARIGWITAEEYVLGGAS